MNQMTHRLDANVSRSTERCFTTTSKRPTNRGVFLTSRKENLNNRGGERLKLFQLNLNTELGRIAKKSSNAAAEIRGRRSKVEELWSRSIGCEVRKFGCNIKFVDLCCQAANETKSQVRGKTASGSTAL